MLLFKNKEGCIPDEKLDEMIIAMYLNIVEYIPDKKRQKELMEMLKMAEKVVRLIESIKNEGSNEGIMKLIKNANKSHSVEEIAKFHNMTVSEVRKFLEM